MSSGGDPFGSNLESTPSPEQQSARTRDITVPLHTMDGIKYVQVPYTPGSPTAAAFVDKLTNAYKTDFVPGTVFPETLAPGQTAPPPGDLAMYEKIIGAPTMRPEEPITAGAPVGPGPSFVRVPNEDDSHFRMRVAHDLLSSQSSTSAVREFTQRYLAGI